MASGRLRAACARLPLAFEINRGQAVGSVRFLSHGPGYGLYLTASEAVLSFPRPLAPSGPARTRPSPALRMKLVGANPRPRVAGLDLLPGKVNYLLGNDPAKWRTGVSTYARVRCAAVYPGVDLIYYGNARQLEYDLVVAPGADPRAITLRFEGAEKLQLDARGNLVLQTPAGPIRQHQPRIYQEVDGSRRSIAGRYVLRGARQVGLQVASYDARRPLVIDPVLSYSSVLGGSGNDAPQAIAVDPAGNAYVTGTTDSTDLPTTDASFDRRCGSGRCEGGSDAFVTKLNADGSGPVYSTYLGGTGEDQGLATAVREDPFDHRFYAYVTGSTTSVNYPTTPGAFQTALAGGQSDAFITKLLPDGSAVAYSTYLGGSSDQEFGTGIAVDAAGNAYVTGQTRSTNFPTLNPFQATFGGGLADAFVTKINPAGSALIYSSYLGGSDADAWPRRTRIAIDSAGNAYVAGETRSGDFPTTRGAFQPAPPGGVSDGFVTKVNAAGSGLVYSTHLGGRGEDYPFDIAVSASGEAYVAGGTNSVNFPTTPGAFQRAKGSADEAFVARLNAAGSALLYSTFLGGSSADWATGIDVDGADNASVTGVTSSADFPTKNALDSTLDSFDAFVTKLDTNAEGPASLVYSTYLGGAGRDEGADLALDPAGSAYVLVGVFQAAGGGQWDALVAKLSDTPPPPTFTLTLNPPVVAGCQTVSGTVTLRAQASSNTVVALSSSNPDVAQPTQAGITVPAQTNSAPFTITTTPVAAATPVTITAQIGAGTVSETLTVRPIGVASLELKPNPATAGSSVTGTITLECPAGPSSIDVTLSSSDPNVAKPGEGHISVAHSQATATFEVDAVSAGTAIIRAMANGITQEATLTVNAPPSSCGQLIQERIGAPAEQDVYRFAATAGDVLFITLLTTQTQDAYFRARAELRAPSGKVVRGNIYSRVEVGPLPETGTYSLLVYDDDSEYRGAYALRLWWLLPDQKQCNMQRLVYGQRLDATIATAAEQDFYQFAGTQGDQFLITLVTTQTQDAYFRARAELRAPSGKVVRGNIYSRVEVGPLPETGTYSLLVYDDDSEYRGAYALALDRLPR